MKFVKLLLIPLTFILVFIIIINFFETSKSSSEHPTNNIENKLETQKEIDEINVSDYSNAQEALNASFGKVLKIPADQKVYIEVPSEHYPNLQTALDDLRLKKVEQGSRIEIRLKPGIYQYHSQVIADGLIAPFIDIKGTNNIEVSTSGVHSITGHSFTIEYYKDDFKKLNYHKITYDLSSVEGITSGQYAIIKDTTGDVNHVYHQGVWEIIDVDNIHNRITILSTGHSAPPKNISASIIIPTTVINWDQNTTALLADHNTNLGTIDNVVFVGTGRPENDSKSGRNIKGWDMVGGQGGVTGVIARNNSSLTLGENFAISSFSGSNVFATQNSHINANYAVSSSAARVGLGSSSGGSLHVNNAIASGNLLDGILAQDNSFTFAKYAQSLGNHRHGFIASGNGTLNSDNGFALGNRYSGAVSIGSILNANNLEASYNGENGLWVYNGGKARAVGLIAKRNKKYGVIAQTGSHITATNAKATDNSIKDITAIDMSNILATGYVGPSTFQPPLNQNSKDGSFIKN